MLIADSKEAAGRKLDIVSLEESTIKEMLQNVCEPP